uniref:G protein-coupled receptor n=1 Tax=Panagrolaimus davidi TaxID=227884 RepID=A0A914QAU5_9BILA
MPSIATERVFATIYVHNYEQKQRTYISAILIIITDICSFVLMLGRAFKVASFLPYLLIVGSSNLFAIITFLNCHRKNLKYYRARFPRSSSNYSLSLRFQIIENIRCEMMQKRLFNVAFCFTITLAGLFAIAYIFKQLLITNICYQLFDLVIAIYATVVPVIGMFDERIWSHAKIMKFRKQNVHPIIQNSTTAATMAPQTTEIKTVFGVEIVKSTSDATNLYFTQLAQTWN